MNTNIKSSKCIYVYFLKCTSVYDVHTPIGVLHKYLLCTRCIIGLMKDMVQGLLLSLDSSLNHSMVLHLLVAPLDLEQEHQELRSGNGMNKDKKMLGQEG